MVLVIHYSILIYSTLMENLSCSFFFLLLFFYMHEGKSSTSSTYCLYHQYGEVCIVLGDAICTSPYHREIFTIISDISTFTVFIFTHRLLPSLMPPPRNSLQVRKNTIRTDLLLTTASKSFKSQAHVVP